MTVRAALRGIRVNWQQPRVHSTFSTCSERSATPRHRPHATHRPEPERLGATRTAPRKDTDDRELLDWTLHTHQKLPGV